MKILKTLLITILILFSFTTGVSQYFANEQAIKIQMSDLNKLLTNISNWDDNYSVYVTTNRDGIRTIQHADARMDGSENDEYALGLKMINLEFDLIFNAINENKSKVYNAKQLVNGLYENNISGMSFKTKKRIHYYTWEVILATE